MVMYGAYNIWVLQQLPVAGVVVRALVIVPILSGVLGGSQCWEHVSDCVAGAGREGEKTGGRAQRPTPKRDSKTTINQPT